MNGGNEETLSWRFSYANASFWLFSRYSPVTQPAMLPLHNAKTTQ